VTIDLKRLPRRTLEAGTTLYRIHRRENGPWFFDHTGNGRFDPTGTPGRGACYWAEQPLGAWVEVFRTRMLLPEDELDARSISETTLAQDITVCDLTDRRALVAGVTVALTAGSDYADSQALADALQASVLGVRWRLRHDLAQRLMGIAWFGQAGPAASSTLAKLPATVTSDIPRDLARRACSSFGYKVMPIAPS
jgi:RES domain